MLALSLVIAILLSAPARAGRPVVVLAPPWVDIDRQIEQAGGTIWLESQPVFGRHAIFNERGLTFMKSTNHWIFVSDIQQLSTLCGTRP